MFHLTRRTVRNSGRRLPLELGWVRSQAQGWERCWRTRRRRDPEDRAKRYEQGIKDGDIVSGVTPRNRDYAEYPEREWATCGAEPLYCPPVSEGHVAELADHVEAEE
jgi:hypothetical protein